MSYQNWVMNRRVLVGIINYFSEDHTYKCIKSFRSEFGDNCLVYVINNGGEFDPKYADIYEEKPNIGIARSWLLFLEEAKGFDFAIFPNNDALVTSGFQRNLFKIDPLELRIYGPVIRRPGGEVWSAGGKLTPFFRNVKHNDQELKSNMLLTEHVSGCCPIFPKSTFGILNELISYKFFFRGEEWYLAFKASERQIPMYIIRDLEIIHEENGSHDRFSMSHVYYAIRAKLMYYRLSSTHLSLSLIKTVIYTLYLGTGGALFYLSRSNLNIWQYLCVTVKALVHNFKFDIIEENQY